jgi:hypothetical protein
MNFLKSVWSLFAFVLISGCNVVELDELTEVPNIQGIPSTQEEFVNAIAGESSREWSTIAFQLEGLQGFQHCRSDDTFIFLSDGTYRYDGGEILCGGEDNQRIKTGTWEINPDTNEIIFDITTNKEYSAQVIAIQDGKMQLRGLVDIFGVAMDIEGFYQTTP